MLSSKENIEKKKKKTKHKKGIGAPPMEKEGNYMEAEKARMNLKTNFATLSSSKGKAPPKGEKPKKQWMKLVSCDWVLCVCGSCNATI